MKVETTDALIVVDVQNDFCPGGALAVMQGDKVVPVINQLMPKFAPDMRLTRGDVEMGRNAVALQRAVHLDGLRGRDTGIVAAHEENGRRRDIGHVLER